MDGQGKGTWSPTITPGKKKKNRLGLSFFLSSSATVAAHRRSCDCWERMAIAGWVLRAGQSIRAWASGPAHSCWGLACQVGDAGAAGAHSCKPKTSPRSPHPPTPAEGVVFPTHASQGTPHLDRSNSQIWISVNSLYFFFVFWNFS